MRRRDKSSCREVSCCFDQLQPPHRIELGGLTLCPVVGVDCTELRAMEDEVESTAKQLNAAAERLRSDFQQHRQVRRSTRRPMHRSGGQLADRLQPILLIYSC